MKKITTVILNEMKNLLRMQGTSQKGAIAAPQVIVVFILLAGLAAGLFLVRQTQIFKPQAQDEPGVFNMIVTPSTFEVPENVSYTATATVPNVSLDHIRIFTAGWDGDIDQATLSQFGGNLACPDETEGATCTVSPSPDTYSDQDDGTWIAYMEVYYNDPDSETVELWCSGEPGHQNHCSGGSEEITANPSGGTGATLNFSEDGIGSTCNASNEKTVSLSWNAYPGATRYTITKAPISPAGFATAIGGDITGTSYTDNASPATYNYTLNAYNQPRPSITAIASQTIQVVVSSCGGPGGSGNLGVSCAANLTTASVGQSVIWTAGANGGTGNYTYLWTGTDNLTGTSNSVTKSYSTIGQKSASVTVTSGTLSKTQACSNSVNVGQGTGGTQPTTYGCNLTTRQCSLVNGGAFGDFASCQASCVGTGTTPVPCNSAPQVGACTPIAGAAACGNVPGTQTVTLTGGSTNCIPVATTPQSCTATLAACTGSNTGTTPVPCTVNPQFGTCTPIAGAPSCGVVQGAQTVTLTGGSANCIQTAGTPQSCNVTLAACTGNTPPVTTPPITSGVTTTEYRFDEDPTTLSSKSYSPYTAGGVNIRGYVFRDPSPGTKTIFVDFKLSDGRVVRRQASIVVAGTPVITSCDVDAGTGANSYTIKGTNFGTSPGTLISGSTNFTITAWSPTEVKASVSSSLSTQSVPITLTSADGIAATGACSAASPLAIGAQLFCPQVKPRDLTGVEVTIVEAKISGQTFRENVTLDKNGIIQGIRTKLTPGQGYKLAIKVPRGLRRVLNNALGGFIAQPGTTNVNFTASGTGAKLPLGDIAPTGVGDGTINVADFQQLRTDFGAGKAAQNSYSDLNLDTWVNSFEWACMRPEFGNSDDPLPQPGPISATSSATISP